jgi:hypothetical protein
MRLSALIYILWLTSVIASSGGELPVKIPTGATYTNGGTIYGQINIPGKTASELALIFLFDAGQGPPPSREKYWRVPDLIETADNNGAFSIDVPAGTYYFIATKRAEESEMGPPHDGDYFYFNGDAKGNPLPLTVTKGTKLNLGVISGAYPYSRSMLLHDKGITAIEGVVLDPEGKPAEWVVVFASLTATTQGRPLFVSERTRKDGKFFLRVHDGGTFYLRVRGLYGAGTPDKGELLSEVAGEKPTKVTLKNGEKLQGITLKMRPFSKLGPDSTYREP